MVQDFFIIKQFTDTRLPLVDKISIGSESDEFKEWLEDEPKGSFKDYTSEVIEEELNSWEQGGGSATAYTRNEFISILNEFISILTTKL